MSRSSKWRPAVGAAIDPRSARKRSDTARDRPLRRAGGCTAEAARDRVRRSRDRHRSAVAVPAVRTVSVSRRRPKNIRSRTSAWMRDARRARLILEDHPRRPASACGPDARARASRRRARRSSSRHSTAPPLGSRRPSSRAGNTRVSLATIRSPRPSKARQVGDRPSSPRSGGPVDDEQPRRPARPGLLRDSIVRQLVVEIRKTHR